MSEELPKTVDQQRRSSRLSLTPRAQRAHAFRLPGIFRKALQGLLCLLPNAACTDKDGEDSQEDSAAPTTSTSITPLYFPQPGETDFHMGLHVFTNDNSALQTQDMAVSIKEALLGAADAETCFQGEEGKHVQVMVQTEFIPSECAEQASMEECFRILDERLDVFTQKGFAVQLLLPVHQRPPDGWLGVNWSTQGWSNESTFVPYQPSIEEGNPYDVLSKDFHVPIIEHLVATGRATQLAVVFVVNEFGYTSKNDTSADWNNDPNWEVARQVALRSTLERMLNNATRAADGQVPVGAKFARVKESHTGWTPPTSSDPDQLDEITRVMEVNRNVFGYSLYVNDSDPVDLQNHFRLSPFFARFPDGRFVIGEFGYECRGDQNQFQEGRRTSGEDIVKALSFWTAVRGFNLFAWNATGPDGGCYSVTDYATGQVFPEAQDTLDGLLRAADEFLGNTERSPCN